MKFTGAKRICGPCPFRDQCLRHSERTPLRQGVFITGVVHKAESHTTRMKHKIDSEEGRARYGQRFATVEPVFGNIRHNKRLNRFTLRGRRQVDTRVEALLPGAQHREARALRKSAVRRARKN